MAEYSRAVHVAVRRLYVLVIIGRLLQICDTVLIFRQTLENETNYVEKSLVEEFGQAPVSCHFHMQAMMPPLFQTANIKRRLFPSKLISTALLVFT